MEPAEIVARRRAEAEAELSQAAGDRSLCAISTAGGRVDGVKHAEGRLAALMDVQRAVRRGDDPGAAAHSVLAAWTEALGKARDGWGPSWVAYRAGGVDELDALAAELAEP